jgi:hypothetical protein
MSSGTIFASPGHLPVLSGHKKRPNPPIRFPRIVFINSLTDHAHFGLRFRPSQNALQCQHNFRPEGLYARVPGDRLWTK